MTGVRDIMAEFINIYRNEPCIWQIKNDYHNREKRAAAYNKFRDMVVKKINGLRTNYPKEKKKVEDSTRSGAESNEVYIPTL
nr:unnamed protein product [Callosobruchus chinensis]